MGDNNYLKDNILYYVAGFVVKKMLLKLTCKGCIANLIRKTDDRQENVASYTILIDVKNKGGLVYASNHVQKNYLC